MEKSERDGKRRTARGSRGRGQSQGRRGRTVNCGLRTGVSAGVSEFFAALIFPGVGRGDQARFNESGHDLRSAALGAVGPPRMALAGK